MNWLFNNNLRWKQYAPNVNTTIHGAKMKIPETFFVRGAKGAIRKENDEKLIICLSKGCSPFFYNDWLPFIFRRRSSKKNEMNIVSKGKCKFDLHFLQKYETQIELFLGFRFLLRLCCYKSTILFTLKWVQHSLYFYNSLASLIKVYKNPSILIINKNLANK